MASRTILRAGQRGCGYLHYLELGLQRPVVTLCMVAIIVHARHLSLSLSEQEDSSYSYRSLDSVLWLMWYQLWG
jgi:hypothetical protein